MRRRRQRLYREPEPEPTPAKLSRPPIDWLQMAVEHCSQWRLRSAAVSIIDSKRRTWLVADRTGLDTFGRELPVGSTAAHYRVFWLKDHVRAVCFHNGDDRSTSHVALMSLLLRSFRIDFPEAPRFSKSERFQQLYDRRGMGRR